MKYIKGFKIACLTLVALPVSAFYVGIRNFIPTVLNGSPISYEIKIEDFDND